MTDIDENTVFRLNSSTLSLVYTRCFGFYRRQAGKCFFKRLREKSGCNCVRVKGVIKLSSFKYIITFLSCVPGRSFTWGRVQNIRTVTKRYVLRKKSHRHFLSLKLRTEVREVDTLKPGQEVREYGVKKSRHIPLTLVWIKQSNITSNLLSYVHFSALVREAYHTGVTRNRRLINEAHHIGKEM